MIKPERILRMSLGLMALAGLSACPDPMPIQPADPSASTAPAGSPLAFTQVSEQDEAAYSDILAGPDGTLHALYQERSKLNLREQVYYRASRDGGQSWSQPLNLLEGDSESRAGFVRLAIDGSGRVYAFWKPFKGFDVVDPSGGNAGTLFYRVLGGEGWSPALEIGTRDRVVSWFPTVAPDGKLHLVWSEASLRPDGSYAPDWQAGRIRQAALDGTALPTTREVYQAPGLRLGNSDVYYFDGYRGLSGYVDATGKPHFSALKGPAGQDGTPAQPTEVVYFDGNAEKPVQPVSRLEAVLKPIRLSPPQLLLDAQGREHLLVLNQALEHAALLDLDPASPVQQRVVYQLAQAKGDIRGFQAVQGPDGQLAALLSLHDTGKADARHDLYVVETSSEGWQAARNLTDNAARASFESAQASASTTFSRLTAYSSRYAAGAYDAKGGLNLLFVNTEITTIMRETDSGSRGDWAGASSSATKVFFYGL